MDEKVAQEGATGGQGVRGIRLFVFGTFVIVAVKLVFRVFVCQGRRAGVKNCTACLVARVTSSPRDNLGSPSEAAFRGSDTSRIRMSGVGSRSVSGEIGIGN